MWRVKSLLKRILNQLHVIIWSKVMNKMLNFCKFDKIWKLFVVTAVGKKMPNFFFKPEERVGKGEGELRCTTGPVVPYFTLVESLLSWGEVFVDSGPFHLLYYSEKGAANVHDKLCWFLVGCLLPSHHPNLLPLLGPTEGCHSQWVHCFVTALSWSHL